MKSNLVKKILTTAMASATLFGNPLETQAPNYSQGLEEQIQNYEKEYARKLFYESQNSENINLPKFKIASGHCSEYMRKSAKSLFGKEYVPGNAWDLQYLNKEICPIKENENIEKLILEGILKPGMALGAKWPVKNIKTYGHQGKDIMGNPIEYTHVVGYLGFNKNNEPEFLHQWGSKKEKATQKELEEKYKLKFVEILDSPK